ncbi:unnamed protein product [Protopolystoma xenopodis]|uniref:Uncharacterized protein n=1 Tax=Protopolystoma xenopodis TaxID=117903 RepID=A0A3S5CNP2_9PLAT|nr:unnamed protein product [Protopolystoma xenopodis]
MTPSRAHKRDNFSHKQECKAAFFCQHCSGSVQAMLIGNCTSLGVGLLLPIVITYASTRHWKEQVLDPDKVWDSMRDIDNPLKPWPEIYARWAYLCVFAVIFANINLLFRLRTKCIF